MHGTHTLSGIIYISFAHRTCRGTHLAFMFLTALQARQSMSYKHLQSFSLVYIYIIIIIIFHTVYASRSFSAYASLAESFVNERRRRIFLFSFIQDDERKYKRRKRVEKGEMKMMLHIVATLIYVMASVRNGVHAADFLFVQTATGATLNGTLTLTGVADKMT